MLFKPLERKLTLWSILAFLAFGCGTRDNSPLSDPVKQSQLDSHSPKLVDYFPLAVSNKWEYTITIPPTGDFFTLNTHIGDRAPIAVGRKLKHGVLNLSYAISARQNNSFRIDVLKDELGLFNDGDEVYLDERAIGRHALSEGHALVRFRVLKDIPPIDSKGFSFPVGVRYMDTAQLYGGLGADAYLTIVPDTNQSHDITVPVGTFLKCMKQSMTVRPEKLLTEQRRNSGSDAENPMYRGWTTESYFAPHVGLVKQQQFDLDGRLLNVMELISYSLAK